MSDYISVKSAAAELSVADRLRLIDELASTVPVDQPPTLSAEWLEEIDCRSKEIDSGTVATEPWPELRNRLRHRVGLDDAT